MKLRTKIPLIAGVVILLAVLVSDGLIFRICRRTMLNQAVTEAAAESEVVFRGFSDFMESTGSRPDRDQVSYYFRAAKDDYTIVAADGETLYNQTMLSSAELDKLPTLRGENSRSYARAFLYGRRLLVFREERSGYGLYHISDVTEVYLQIYRLAVEIAVISLTILGVAILVLFWVLRWSLKPLQTLSSGANAIAEGAYSQRISEDRKDEIGELGRDFNCMAEAVERHVREVEDSEEKKTLFMGALTHELKTPLTAISGYAQTLQSVELSPEDRELALGYIVSESKRLDRLSKKMLRLLELDRETELVMEPVAIRELFEGAKQSCSAAASDKGVSIEIGEAQGELQADRDLMTEVIINLVDNAIKASAPGGTVRLYTDGSTMIVEDEGTGIPAQEIDRLTEPFYMVDKSRSRKSGGAGLGLALTAAILRRHGMTLHIDSAVGRGTKISLFSVN